MREHHVLLENQNISSQLLIHETDSTTTVREEKVGHSLSTNQLESKVTVRQNHEMTQLSLLLLSSKLSNEEKIRDEGGRRVKKEIREIEKEQKIDKNRANIRASDRFREIEKVLKQGFRKDDVDSNEVRDKNH